jgi:hypothetical protein
MTCLRRPGTLALGLLLTMALGGCRGFNPVPLESVPFLERAQTQAGDEVTVTAAVLSAEEAREVFDVKLYKKRIQPVWLEITNHTPQDMAFLPRSLDPAYFSSIEASQKTNATWHSKKAKKEKRLYFHRQQMPFSVPAGETVSGFVYANRDKGVRFVVVEVIAEYWSKRLEFLLEVPGFKADFHLSRELEPYPEEEVVDLDGPGLYEWIAGQPPCVRNAKGTKEGDPLNLVIIGTEEAIWPAFFRAGWDPTAQMTAGSAAKTGVFGIFGGAYRYAPISTLYVYGRGQDIALQKVRSNIHYRNHLRLWLAPVTFRGLPVYIGQISRDIGSRLTTKSSTLTTHRIDPDVDETRASLIQDLLFAQAIEAFAYAPGVWEVPMEAPRGNLTGDPWFSDGRRAVMLLSEEPHGLEEVEYVEWESSPVD